jgi:hypothetical protein
LRRRKHMPIPPSSTEPAAAPVGRGVVAGVGNNSPRIEKSITPDRWTLSDPNAPLTVEL